jgi:catechol 2,3-dioxygenase-like lactoylglutathione lyase family enzyme
MRTTGITFVGTRTDARPAMAEFLREVLGLSPAERAAGMDADVFDLPDGSSFAVAPAADDERTVGFLVADIDVAASELRSAGVETADEIAENDRYRYLHFRAPDGQLYELVERRP